MKVLVLNCGSSSIKYKLYDMDSLSVMAAGGIEKIGLPGAFLKTKKPVEEKILNDIPTHDEGLEMIFKSLTDPEKGVLKSLDEIDAVGHRMVHGGEKFNQSTILTDQVLEEFVACSELAPLHNPANLKGVKAVAELMPNMVQVGVFDTAFHQTMPDCAALYAIDPKYYKKMGIRKYGFHGTSHKFIVQQAAKFLKKPVSKVNLVTCHMGNGSSLSAVKNGQCVDTSMGLTPLAGMVMGTRCGDIDPAAVLSIMEAEKLTPAQADTLLNKRSGLLALTGSSDCRDICGKAAKGDKQAELALEMLAYRTALYIGGYNTVIGGADAIIMTGGIGENSTEVRERIINRLGALGIKLDKAANKKAHGVVAVLSAKGSKIPVVAIPTNEELAIAQDTVRVLS